MSEIALSDEETKVILGEEAGENLRELDGTKQAAVINRLLTIVRSAYDPSHFIYERIANLDIIHFGEQGRLYAKVVTNVPQGNTAYHVIYVFYIDSRHEYNRSDLATFSHSAQATLDEITDLSTVDDVEAYLESHDALGEDDLTALLS